MKFLEKIFRKKNKKILNLEDLFESGLFSKEEFLRFQIVKTEMKLRKQKTDLSSFLKNQKKKK